VKLPTRLRTLTPLALLACLLLGCNLVQPIRKEIEKASAPQLLTSPDGKLQLTVPVGWRNDPELHAEAGLRASNRLSEMYAIVLTQSKDDFAEKVTLEAFTDLTRQQVLSNINAPDATAPVAATVAKHPALQYTVRGVVENIKVVYLITVVETNTSFHQILTWTLHSRFDQNWHTLDEVTQSFREISSTPPVRQGSPAAPPPPPAAPRRKRP
jgi:hypothetical protein